MIKLIASDIDGTMVSHDRPELNPELQKVLGIKKEETIAIGDNINDLELLSQASYSIAIGNARDEVKQAARYIAPTRDQDGVLQIMKHFL